MLNQHGEYCYKSVRNPLHALPDLSQKYVQQYLEGSMQLEMTRCLK